MKSRTLAVALMLALAPHVFPQGESRPARRAGAQASLEPARLSMRALPSPARGLCAEPWVTVGPDRRFYVSWVRRAGADHHVLEFASSLGKAWTKPQKIAEGANWFVNWADFPSIAIGANGAMAAHWLEKTGSGTFHYGVRIVCSRNGGRTWTKPAWLHTDRSPAEHGFCSLVALPRDRFAAVWLDGRALKKTGNMTLRTTVFGADGTREPEQLLDARVCECCATSAAATEDGVVAVYRDRSDLEVRDVNVARVGATGIWSAPAACHVDGWKTPG